MGCDIHGVVERRHNGKWVAFRTLHSFSVVPTRGTDRGDDWAIPAARERNYERFGALAGIRHDGPSARGLPDDASDTARMLFQIEGDHTPSWLPLDEAARIFIETECAKVPDYWKKYPASAYFGVESDNLADYRLVFWFDS